MGIFRELFIWWDGATIGTRFWTWRKGVKVGEDALGNVYYRERNGPRRWVIYNGLSEASLVPAEWHGWLHYTTDILPQDESYELRQWEKPHLPNMTGTPEAYRPQGSTLAKGQRPPATGDYEPWRPD